MSKPELPKSQPCGSARGEPGLNTRIKMFAVIKTGGKQYRVAAEDVITIATLEGEPGAAVTFDQVLMVTNDNGTQVGAPLVAGVTVTGEVVEHTRGDEGHRLQEAPPPEFAPQARASPGLHRGADHRDPRVAARSPRRLRRKRPPRLPRTTLRRPTAAE